MRRNLKRGLFTGSFIVSALLMSSTLAGYCADKTILSAINIEGANNSFNITLKTSKDTQVMTRVPSGNRLIIELDDTKASELIKTSFKNASQIDDIIVQPIGNNKTRLFISGNNVSTSRIVIDSTQTPAVADKYARENNAYVNTRNNTNVVENVAPAIEEQVAQAKTISSEEFINQNTNKTAQEPAPAVATAEVQDNLSGQEVNNADAETTGVVSSAPSEETTSLEDNNINPEATDKEANTDSELFKPAADLEVPANQNSATTINNTQGSAAATTAQSIINTGIQDPSFFSKPWLIRFAIVFILVTLLVAYLRKEKLISFRPKAKKPALNREHLDIYRSLHNSTKATPNYYRKTSKSGISTLDSVSNKNQYIKPREVLPVKNKNITQHNAVSSYKKQTVKPAAVKANATIASYNSANVTKKASTINSNSASTNRQLDSNNIGFLKNMADLYEKSGRHDLAMNIQKNIRKSTAKT